MNETIQLGPSEKHALAADFAKLAELQDGWLDGDGKAPPHRALEWLNAQLVSTFPGAMTLPFVCATPDGGVFLEWRHGDWIISAEFPLPERRCVLQATNTKTSATLDEEYLLDDAGAFAAVYRFVRRFV